MTATNGKKEQKRNDTVDADCGIKFDLGSTVQAPEVKVYRGQPPFLA